MGIYLNVDDEIKVEQELVHKTYALLKLKTNYIVDRKQRFITYYRIIGDLIIFDQKEKIDYLKSLIVSGVSIHEAFIELVKNDDTDILNLFKNDILHYEDEDFSNTFFC